MSPDSLQIALWQVDILLELVLWLLVFKRRLYGHLPVFATYATLLLPREVFVYVLYRTAGYGSRVALYAFWITEAMLVIARGLAAAELGWSAARAYPGFRVVLKWALIAVAAVFLVITATVAFARAGRLPPLVLGLERDLNLTATVILLVIFGLSRKYEVVLEAPRKLIAIGLFVYSAIQILNNAIPPKWLTAYFRAWDIARVASFSAALLFWIVALWRPVAMPSASSSVPTDFQALRALVRDGNDLLRRLSARLGQFRKAWKP